MSATSSPNKEKERENIPPALTGCDIFPPHSNQLGNNNNQWTKTNPTPPPTARTSRNTHKQAKKQGDGVRVNRNPKKPTPAIFAGVPSKSKHAPKTPT